MDIGYRNASLLHLDFLVAGSSMLHDDTGWV